MLVVVAGYVLLSALVNSGFVLVANRFGAKTVWLTPIAVVLILYGSLQGRSYDAALRQEP